MFRNTHTLLALLFPLLLSAPADAAIKCYTTCSLDLKLQNCSSFCLDLPDDWTAYQNYLTFTFTANDQAASISITIDDMKGRLSADGFAADLAAKLRGSSLSGNDNGGYTFSFQGKNKEPSTAVIIINEEKKRYLFMSINGNSPYLRPVLRSIRPVKGDDFPGQWVILKQI